MLLQSFSGGTWCISRILKEKNNLLFCITSKAPAPKTHMAPNPIEDQEKVNQSVVKAIFTEYDGEY